MRSIKDLGSGAPGRCAARAGAGSLTSAARQIKRGRLRAFTLKQGEDVYGRSKFKSQKLSPMPERSHVPVTNGMLEEMYGIVPDGIPRTDALLDYSRAVSGAIYFVPSIEALERAGVMVEDQP